MDVIIKADFRKLRKKDFLREYWSRFRERSFAVTADGRIFVNTAAETPLTDVIYNALHALSTFDDCFLDIIESGVNVLYPEIRTIKQFLDMRVDDPRRMVVFMSLMLPLERKRRKIENNSK